MLEYWYAVQVFAGKEQKALEQIMESKITAEVFLPKRVMMLKKAGSFKRQVKPLFNGYLFLKYSQPLEKITAQDWIKSLQKDRLQPIVFNILDRVDTLNNQNQMVQSISSEEIQWIFDLTNKNNEIEISRYLKVGSQVQIVSGPMKGQEAKIKKVDPHKKRIKVEIFFLGRSHVIDLAGEMVQGKI